MIKKTMLLAILWTGGAAPCHAAFPQYQAVQISTDTTYAPTLQPGAINITSATILGINNAVMRIRRPVLQYNSGTQVNLETGNNGTSSVSQVIFPDGAVYTETQTTLLNAVINSTASWGNYQTAGIRPTEKPSNDTFYTAYVVKSTGTTASLTANTTDFVVVLSTYQPIQANFSNLNTFFGSNSWVPICTFLYGDGKTTHNAFVKFAQSGNRVIFQNNTTGNVEANEKGAMLATTASASALTWTYAAGNSLASGQIPANISIGSLMVAQGAGTRIYILNSGNSVEHSHVTGLSSGIQVVILPDLLLTDGISSNANTTTTYDILLIGYIDTSLGIGGNPQL